MNRTKQKQAKRAQAQQMAAIYEMRALVHRVATDLYVRTAAPYMPEGNAECAQACIRAGIAFVDALNSYVPAPAGVHVVEKDGQRATYDHDAKTITVESVEPGSVEEMEAHE